jgi:Bacterial PH domain
LLAVLGIWFLAARRVRTTIDADGVRASSMFRGHSCRWSDVTEVDLDIDANDGPPMVYSVKIHRRGARPFTLAAPSDSVRKDRHADPTSPISWP